MDTPAHTAELRKTAKKGIDSASETTLRKIFGKIKKRSFTSKNAFRKEILSRIKNYEKGKVKTLSLETLEAKAKQYHARLLEIAAKPQP